MDNVIFAVSMLAGGFLLGQYTEHKRPFQMLCENSPAKQLVSETVRRDGAVECVYIRKAARTLQEIVRK